MIKLLICGISVALAALYLLITITFIGCISGPTTTPTVSPMAIIKTDSIVWLNWASSMLSGSITGAVPEDSVTTLWVCDSADVEIEAPDSLNTPVRIKRPGTYTFVLWAVDKNGLMDSSHTHITILSP